MFMRATLLAATSAIALAGAAAASTVTALSVDDFAINGGLTDAGETLSFTFTASEALRVQNFVSVSSVGLSGGADLALVTFGIEGAFNISETYDAFAVNGATTQADSSLPGFDLAAGETFTVFFEYGDGVAPTSHQFSFATTAVPLPAGGLLLLTALGGFAALRRKS